MDDQARARAYIEQVEWRFAKTYAKTWPHEYTVREWRPELDDDFFWFAQYILDHGMKERFFSRVNVYYYIDGLKYWTMDDSIPETVLINRQEGITNREEFIKRGLKYYPVRG
jgi:hypothetical protein